MTSQQVDPRAPMTIGALARRTGVTVKALRSYEDLGLVATVGRSRGNYRLFGEDALWCVALVEELRSAGLTLAEITELAELSPDPGDALGHRLAGVLRAARARAEQGIEMLRARLEHLDRFEADHAEGLAGRADVRAGDPCVRGPSLDSPTGGRS